MGDPGGDHRAGDSVLQQPGHSLLLGPAAGEQQPGLSSAVYGYVSDCKACWLANSGEHADVPFRPADGRMGGLLPGDHPLPAAEADVEVPPAVAADRHALQHRLAFHGLTDGGQRLVVGKEGADALRQVTSSAHGDTPSYPFLIVQCMRRGA